MSPDTAAIIVAEGKASGMAAAFATVSALGRPPDRLVVLSAFEKCPSVAAIVLVVPADDVAGFVRSPALENEKTDRGCFRRPDAGRFRAPGLRAFHWLSVYSGARCSETAREAGAH